MESSGSGFLKNGKPKILFEGHRFWSWLEKRGHNPERLSKSYPDLIYKRWTREHYLGGQKEYTRFHRAYKIDPVAAVYATSWGLFQIMGENFHKGGNCANRSKDKSHFSETENKLKSLSRLTVATWDSTVQSPNKLLLDASKSLASRYLKCLYLLIMFSLLSLGLSCWEFLGQVGKIWCNFLWKQGFPVPFHGYSLP